MLSFKLILRKYFVTDDLVSIQADIKARLCCLCPLHTTQRWIAGNLVIVTSVGSRLLWDSQYLCTSIIHVNSPQWFEKSCQRTLQHLQEHLSGFFTHEYMDLTVKNNFGSLTIECFWGTRTDVWSQTGKHEYFLK